MTYILEALRSLLSGTWDTVALGRAVTAIVLVGIPSISLALMTLLGRVSRD